MCLTPRASTESPEFDKLSNSHPSMPRKYPIDTTAQMRIIDADSDIAFDLKLTPSLWRISDYFG
jgi:hypothetical protein